MAITITPKEEGEVKDAYNETIFVDVDRNIVLAEMLFMYMPLSCSTEYWHEGSRYSIRRAEERIYDGYIKRTIFLKLD